VINDAAVAMFRQGDFSMLSNTMPGKAVDELLKS
jgi:hypothetical protein